MVFFPKTLGGVSFEKLVKHEGKEPIFSIKRANCCESRNLPQTPQTPKRTTRELPPSGLRQKILFCVLDLFLRV